MCGAVRLDPGLNPGLNLGLGFHTGLGSSSLGADIIKGDIRRESRVCGFCQPRAPQPDQKPDTQQRQKHQQGREHNEIGRCIGLGYRLHDGTNYARRNIRKIRDHLFHGISLTSKRLI